MRGRICWRPAGTLTALMGVALAVAGCQGMSGSHEAGGMVGSGMIYQAGYQPGHGIQGQWRHPIPTNPPPALVRLWHQQPAGPAIQPAVQPGVLPPAMPPGDPTGKTQAQMHPYAETLGLYMPPQPPGPLPTELNKVSHPPYTVAPPDVLTIEAVRLTLPDADKLQPGDIVNIQVSGTLPDQPILGKYRVGADGRVHLGFSYGSIKIGGMTLDQAQRAIRDHLAPPRGILRNPQVFIGLEQRPDPQLDLGGQRLRAEGGRDGALREYLVRPDGTIHLGAYGCVYVAGLTLNQVKWVVERHLSQYFIDPLVAVDVRSYGSKVYYVILDYGGAAPDGVAAVNQQVFRFPYTGNETVLDAIAQVSGLPAQASQRRIWVARPSPCHAHCNQILPVDWKAIVQGASTCTNYQIFPGDRIYVSHDPFVATDRFLNRLLQPIDRVFNSMILGTSAVNGFRGGGGGGGNILVPVGP